MPVFCEACAHRSTLERSKVPDGRTVQELVQMLRCSARGSGEASMRIIYTAAGGLAYDGMRPSS